MQFSISFIESLQLVQFSIVFNVLSTLFNNSVITVNEPFLFFPLINSFIAFRILFIILITCHIFTSLFSKFFSCVSLFTLFFFGLFIIFFEFQNQLSQKRVHNTCYCYYYGKSIRREQERRRNL